MNLRDIKTQISAVASGHDAVRRDCISRLHQETGRNVIIYYSGWLQKMHQYQSVEAFSLTDSDKNGFMAAVQGLDRELGLDLVLHTPGGDMAATESLVDYLRNMFDRDVRAIIPQLALSAGTMVACSCRQILMGKHSSLGPIDPQIGGVPAHGIVEEVQSAMADIKKDPNWAAIWQPIIAKYHPTLIGEAQKTIKWSEEMVQKWLETGMFHGDKDAHSKAQQVVKELGDHALMKSHARHISPAQAITIGLNVEFIEEKQSLQDAVLAIHHAAMLTLEDTNATKIIENQNGTSYVGTVSM